ncbi:hypothetical protein DEU56DRAFT_843252 [Suillus clintonianus]|uniref:uncharacterized protein n=1 Tax=Suillus clintonianus TaxID=1904413 RepID=UPI001B8838BA|nr:uncharacterized protein DEU56DRAFT_843252 [Suillus clintonianus]KAG2111755.1 hypothetical protein DEU56DRAFT_843252 [Suillus clintonianus]
MIYEFDASTLETVGTPFEGHTKLVTGLALSFDCTLLASAARDGTIKLWAYESRQLLASFDVQNPLTLILSPDSRQLTYTTYIYDDHNIYICNTPPDVISQAAGVNQSTLNNLLNSDATRHPPARHRRQPISTIPMFQRPLPTIDPRQPISLRLSKFFHFSPRTNIPPVRHVQPRNPLDVPATSPLPHSLSGQVATQFDQFEISSPPPPSTGVTQFIRQNLPFLVPRHSHGPPVVEVAAGRKFTVTYIFSPFSTSC